MTTPQANLAFESITLNLSVRAMNVLSKLGVNDLDALKQLSEQDLIRARNCGRKTLNEIEELRSTLWPPTEDDVDQGTTIFIDFDKVPQEVFEALMGVLSVRSVHVLNNMIIGNISSFMTLHRNQLLECKNCGRKTADEILRVQSELNDFALHLFDKYGDLFPVRLIDAPCLAGSTNSYAVSDNSVNVLIDVKNPSTWLLGWIESLARSKKQKEAFFLRKGMAGLQPMTLEVIAERLGGLTRERVRQMEKAIEKKASTAHQQNRLSPLFEEALDIVKEKGGMVGLDELTKNLLCRGKDGDQFSFATELLSFFSTFQAWKETGLLLKKDGIVRTGDSLPLIHHLSSIIEEVASSMADERHTESLWSIDRDRLKSSLLDHIAKSGFHPDLESVTEVLLDAVLKQRKDRIRARKDRIYSIELWRLRFGKVIQMLDTLLHQIGKPAHFTEIAKYVIKWRSGFSDRNVHASLNRVSGALLWDRGTFVHKDNVVIPYSLIHDVERWILNVLADDVPFISIYGAYINFIGRCKRAGFPSEVALYTCLRQSSHQHLVFPKFPRVYLKARFSETIPTLVVFEDYLRDAGGQVTQQEVKEFGLDKLFLKDFQLYQLSHQVSNVIRTADWGYIHLDNTDLCRASLDPLIDYTQQVISREEHCSVDKIYCDKQVTCRFSGIDSPVMLYSAFQYFADDLFSFDGYPRIARKNENDNVCRQTIGKHILNYLSTLGKPCPYEFLEQRFVDQLGYKEQQVYSIVREAEVCLYHPGCVIHLRALNWDEAKQRDIEDVAGHFYRNAKRAGMYYGRISHLIESPDLPKLPSGLHWSGTMLADLLKKEGRYLILGNAREAFVPRENGNDLQSFEALIGKLLEKEWGGAANLSAFEKSLLKAGLVKRRLTQSMLGTGGIVVIQNGEIILKEILIDAQKP